MKRTIRLAALAMIAAIVGVTGPAVAANAAGSPGNSGAAHACQQGGYLSLVGADGTTFSNVGACVSFGAHGGQFATGLIIPAGETATLSNAAFTACDPLEYGYQLNLGANVFLDSKGPECVAGVPAAGATIGPFPTASLLRIYLTDFYTFLPDTFYSDGVHALVTPPNPYTVDITDSKFGASGPTDPRVPAGPGDGNITVTVTIG